MNRIIEIMDTTLRDGEQTRGVSFNAYEKLTITSLLIKEARVDRIEVGSARVSKGEEEAVSKIATWAKENDCINKIEVLGFIDGKQSVDWTMKCGAKVINLLCKGSLNHVTGQLKKTPDEHVKDIKNNIAYATQLGIDVNLYLEDWSNGMVHSREYVFKLVDELKNQPLKRIMLPDTLGILNPDQAYEFCDIMINKYPGLHFDFHAHNDYDLATANVFSAIKAGIKGIHTTVNGLGERAGNASLASVVGVLADHLRVEFNVNESRLTKVSKLVETFSGIRIPENKPLVGDNVFTQTCGVHADGDAKNNLYFNNLLPERFGRVRQYALGKTSGKANIKKNLEELGLELDNDSLLKVTAKIIELGDKKETVTTEDLPYIISDVLHNGSTEKSVIFKHYTLSLTNGLKPLANISIEINGKSYEQAASGDGQYDAFIKALWVIYDLLGKEHPTLIDYHVAIPPGGKSDALVETTISWLYKDKQYRTRALDPDQTEAAIKATEKMLNLIENNK